MIQSELQQDVQRITTAFMDRIAQAGDPACDGQPLNGEGEILPLAGASGIEGAPASVSPAERQELMRRVLLYASNALDIATGPSPEINALDLLVFTHLCHGALERYWIPRRLGARGARFAIAFSQAEDELWQVLARAVNEKQQADLLELITSWEREHPTQYWVEGVRFQEFAKLAGHGDQARGAKSRGLLGQVRSATLAADQALLISERAFFFVHRLPFLLRLQARLGVQETISDLLLRMGNVEALLEQVPTLRPMVMDLCQLTQHATAAAREASALATAFTPYLRFLESRAGSSADKSEARLTETLELADRLAERGLLLMQGARELAPSDLEKTIDRVDARADRVVRRWVAYLLLVGLGWAVFFWTGSFLVERAS